MAQAITNKLDKQNQKHLTRVFLLHRILKFMRGWNLHKMFDFLKDKSHRNTPWAVVFHRPMVPENEIMRAIIRAQLWSMCAKPAEEGRLKKTLNGWGSYIKRKQRLNIWLVTDAWIKQNNGEQKKKIIKSKWRVAYVQNLLWQSVKLPDHYTPHWIGLAVFLNPNFRPTLERESLWMSFALWFFFMTIAGTRAEEKCGMWTFSKE